MNNDTPKHHDCWNHIGVWGDGSCPELATFTHCRNCPKYSAAAAGLLDRELPADYRAESTRHYSTEKNAAAHASQSAVIFRIGAEWLALDTAVFREVCDVRPIHSLPHRRNGVVLGIVNVHGELLACVSLAALLGVDKSAAVKTERRLTHARLLVASSAGARLVFPVDEVHGIHRFDAKQLVEAPATVAKAASTYTRAILPWQGQAVGVLDEGLLFYSLNKSLA